MPTISISRRVLLAWALIASALSAAVAQQPPPPASPPKYHMEVVAVFETEPLQYIFVVTYPSDRKFAFKSVESLKKCITTLPKNSTLEWAPTDAPIGNEPLVTSAPEMAAFKVFCSQAGINFVLVPSG